MRPGILLTLTLISFTGSGSEVCAQDAIDLDGETQRHVVVDREPGQYLGHPSTLLLEDGRTMLCVYLKGHGRGAIVYKRSTDGGLTWSRRLPTPVNWATSLETPTPTKRTAALRVFPETTGWLCCSAVTDRCGYAPALDRTGKRHPRTV